MRRVYLATIHATLISSIWLVAFTTKPDANVLSITPATVTDLFLPLIVSHPNPPRVLFADDFRDPYFTESNWTEEGGEWDIINGKYTLSYNGVSVVGVSSWTEYTFVVDVLGIDVIDKIVFFRFIAADNSYGVDIRSNPYNDIVLTNNIPGKGYETVASAHHTIPVWF